MKDNSSHVDNIIKNVKKAKKRKENIAAILKEFLIVNINSKYYGIQLEYLREVFDLNDRADVVGVPFTPSYILGIINYRGDIIPVLSFGEILGVHNWRNDYRKVAILEAEFKMAFLFNEIVDLKNIDIQEIKKISNGSNKSNAFVTQNFVIDDKSVNVIDIFKMFSSKYFKK